ncbi:hypothetical protein COO59_05790 [Mixta theicola]|uniref:Colicin transporter n=1 Tax=Mixta theicola TaxID=1458355 RepID=A0A2K1QC77_9GAMM|nr:colicin E1 family microcin immunity protein [Mixta theicola]PNS12631.1 hypothetical protein COO59_05790 [Mixta theicola]GLR10198.1 hypothetical protein GCM10007905_29180 [Mixta theicola]
MTLHYYLRNILIGVLCLVAIGYKLLNSPDDLKHQLMLSHAIISSLLFPFSKLTVETMALKFTTKDFWHRGLFKEDIGKNGLYAIFWVFCFYFAIPLSIVFLLIVKKTTRQSWSVFAMPVKYLTVN